jgi:hypothetical protein
MRGGEVIVIWSFANKFWKDTRLSQIQRTTVSCSIRVKYLQGLSSRGIIIGQVECCILA